MPAAAKQDVHPRLIGTKHLVDERLLEVRLLAGAGVDVVAVGGDPLA
jgi:hypothetical protein